MSTSANKKYRKILISAIIILLVAGLIVLRHYYSRIYKANVSVSQRGSVSLYIPTNSTWSDVKDKIQSDTVLIDQKSFFWVAEKKNYPSHIHPGRYILNKGMNNNEIVNKLRSGLQEPVDVVFHNIRTLPQLAGRISQQIEADSIAILAAMTDEKLMDSLGFTNETFPALFIPNTYEFWWNTNAYGFIHRMHQEYQRFWTEERRQKAKSVGLDPLEVITLASIVDEETYYSNEMPRIAGVYINRLHKRYRLQADPTIKYALGDFTIKRVLKKHLKIESPYNTYLHYGLPPGPISIPSISAIDAVLNYEKHQYLYFCAKDDFSGYHVFAKNLYQHNQNARKYQRALNRERIMK